MLRFYAPQRAGAAIFARQFGDPPAAPPQEQPPPPVVQVVQLEAGAPSTSLPVVSCGQIKLDAEFGMVAAPGSRTVMVAKIGATA